MTIEELSQGSAHNRNSRFDGEGNPWRRKLEQFAELGSEELEWIDHAIRDQKEIPADLDVIHEGERPDCVKVVLSGLLCRYTMLEDGRRQITAFLIPGDLCDLHVFLLQKMDHAIATLTPSIVATVNREEILDANIRLPRLTLALWWTTLVDEAVLRQWVVNIGRRSAYERLSHLLWELYLRHAAVGAIAGHNFALPLSQAQLADTLGLSVVHINRTLQRLRKEKMIEIDGRRLTILDPNRLKAISNFDPTYLHQQAGPSK